MFEVLNASGLLVAVFESEDECQRYINAKKLLERAYMLEDQKQTNENIGENPTQTFTYSFVYTIIENK